MSSRVLTHYLTADGRHRKMRKEHLLSKEFALYLSPIQRKELTASSLQGAYSVYPNRHL
jgi:hypothetical protein